MKDDTISRQAVLKLLSTMPPEEAITKAMLIQNVKYMSAAQPEKRTEERTEKHACDCISRQAAIEKLISNLTYMHTFGADRSIDLIEELPSAQPYTDEEIQRMQYIEQAQFDKIRELAYQEGKADAVAEIIRCRECKHYTFADNRAFGFPAKRCEWTGFEDVDDDDFCSRAERREVSE